MNQDTLAQKAAAAAKATTPKKEPPTGDTLEAKIARASIDVGTFLPDRDNQGKYTYISADQIMTRCGDALAREGVVIFPEITSLSLDFHEKAKTPFHAATLTLTIHISAGGDAQRSLLWSSVGVDYTTPDKAVAKAITTGVKYFIMKLLSVGVGNEDGEHEDHSIQRDISGDRVQPRAEDLDIDAIARAIKTQSDFFKSCKKYLNVGPVAVKRALDGLDPVEWRKAEPGRTTKGALQRILDYSIAEAEKSLSD